MKPFLPILLILLCHGVAEGEDWSALSPALSAHTITGIVTRVIDGDTIELATAASMARRSPEAKAAGHQAQQSRHGNSGKRERRKAASASELMREDLMIEG